MSYNTCQQCQNLDEVAIAVFKTPNKKIPAYKCPENDVITVPGVPACLKFQQRPKPWHPRTPTKTLEVIKPEVVLDKWLEAEQ